MFLLIVDPVLLSVGDEYTRVRFLYLRLSLLGTNIQFQGVEIDGGLGLVPEGLAKRSHRYGRWDGRIGVTSQHSSGVVETAGGDGFRVTLCTLGRVSRSAQRSRTNGTFAASGDCHWCVYGWRRYKPLN